MGVGSGTAGKGGDRVLGFVTETEGEEPNGSGGRGAFARALGGVDVGEAIVGPSGSPGVG